MAVSADRDGAGRRLETWKEIGAFLNRDARTVRRWEQERGLPVRRVPGSRSKVYAYSQDLRAWLDQSGETLGETMDAPPARRTPRPRILLAAAAAAAVALIAALFWRTQAPEAGRPTMPGAERPGRHVPDPAARRLYLAGTTYWNQRTPDGLQKAQDSFTQAVVRDPGYAEAYVGLAKTYNLLREYTLMPPAQAYPRAKAAAERAIALDEGLSEAHAALGFVSFFWEWDVDKARREFARAVELDPRSAIAHHWRATFLYHLGETQAALASIDKAQELAPESAAILADRATILAAAGRVQEAVAILEDLERAQPNFLSSHAYLAQIFEEQGDFNRYVAELEHAAKVRGDPAAVAVARAARAGLTRGGREGMYRAMEAEQSRLLARGRVTDLDLACTYARLGEREKTLEHLRRAMAEHDANLVSVGVLASYRALRSDPEFRRIVAPVGVLRPVPAGRSRP
ncbi:MAG TPA: hypothetical protein VF559_10875 [Caulobacteraceae bacterium]|jgi:tetratricopeptide (TPR) repeat protein